jgi:tetratricopeptide (TPR) repeat protein
VDCVTFRPDGRRLLTASDHAARLWPLDAPVVDADEYVLLAQFLSCARAKTGDARRVPVGANELARSWERLRQEFPNAFTTPPADAFAWYAEAARASERNRLWSAAVAHLERLAKREPTRADLLDRKGRANAELGRLEEAMADFATATKLGADRPGPWYRQALLHLHLGDPEGFRLARAAMLRHFDWENDVRDTLLAVRTCVLAHDTKENSGRVVAIAERCLAARPRDPDRMHLLGAALFRAGRYRDAVRTLLEARKISGKEGAVNDLFLAMTYLRMHESEQAQACLQRAARTTGQAAKAGAGGPGGTQFAWSDRLELLLLRREAETILNAQKP